MPYKKLIEGFEKFREDYFRSDKRVAYQKLVEEGQKPETLVIACSDSRIDPAILTNSNPGEFFAVRNVAALVPPYNNGGLLRGTSSAIEFAVRQLQVKHIVILGHAGCGGINALATGNYQATENHRFQFLHHWLNIAGQAKDAIYTQLKTAPETEKIRALEQAAIVVSLENLLSFPWIKARHDSGSLHIHGWYFDMKTGALLEYNPAQGSFENITSRTEISPAPDNADYLIRFLEHYSKNCYCKTAT